MSTAATQTANEVTKTHRNFRTSPEVEDFYRYVLENNFRQEAHVMLRAVHEVLQKQKKSSRKGSKGKKSKRKLH